MKIEINSQDLKPLDPEVLKRLAVKHIQESAAIDEIRQIISSELMTCNHSVKRAVQDATVECIGNVLRTEYPDLIREIVSKHVGDHQDFVSMIEQVIYNASEYYGYYFE